MKNPYQFDLLNLPETVRIVATGAFGFLAYLGVFFLLLVFVDFVSEPHSIDRLTWCVLLFGLLGTGIGWLGLYYLKLLERLKIGKCLDKYSRFLA